ncbi:MAG: hypothetical protein M3R16_05040 [Pseudomonadota bacterium]|nr:hypothetical protein [Pseudomonadota bacterium]
MIAWLLITGLMSGAGGQAEAEALPIVAGSGREQARYEAAAQEWLDRTQARVALPDADAHEKVAIAEGPTPQQRGGASASRKSTQVAPSQPRTAEPAPLDWTALDALLQSAEAYRLAEAQWLRAAMLDRHRQALANAAWQTGIALKRAQDDEAVAVILLLAA